MWDELTGLWLVWLCEESVEGRDISQLPSHPSVLKRSCAADPAAGRPSSAAVAALPPSLLCLEKNQFTFTYFPLMNILWTKQFGDCTWPFHNISWVMPSSLLLLLILLLGLLFLSLIHCCWRRECRQQPLCLLKVKGQWSYPLNVFRLLLHCTKCKCTSIWLLCNVKKKYNQKN